MSAMDYIRPSPWISKVKFIDLSCALKSNAAQIFFSSSDIFLIFCCLRQPLPSMWQALLVVVVPPQLLQCRRPSLLCCVKSCVEMLTHQPVIGREKALARLALGTVSKCAEKWMQTSLPSQRMQKLAKCFLSSFTESVMGSALFP